MLGNLPRVPLGIRALLCVCVCVCVCVGVRVCVGVWRFALGSVVLPFSLGFHLCSLSQVRGVVLLCLFPVVVVVWLFGAARCGVPWFLWVRPAVAFSVSWWLWLVASPRLAIPARGH